jgi:hypothetical protein
MHAVNAHDSTLIHDTPVTDTPANAQSVTNKVKTTLLSALKFDCMRSGPNREKVISDLKGILNTVKDIAAAVWKYSVGLAFKAGEKVGNTRFGSEISAPLAMASIFGGIAAGILTGGPGAVTLALIIPFAFGLIEGGNQYIPSNQR